MVQYFFQNRKHLYGDNGAPTPQELIYSNIFWHLTKESEKYVNESISLTGNFDVLIHTYTYRDLFFPFTEGSTLFVVAIRCCYRLFLPQCTGQEPWTMCKVQ